MKAAATAFEKGYIGPGWPWVKCVDADKRADSRTNKRVKQVLFGLDEHNNKHRVLGGDVGATRVGLFRELRRSAVPVMNVDT